MKNFTSLKFAMLFLAFATIGAAALGQSDYVEDFDVAEYWAGGSSGSYTLKSYTNDAALPDDQFNSNDAVRESTNSMTGYAWRLRNAGTPYLVYECTATVIGFSMYLAHWNPAISMNIAIEYSLNSGYSYELIAGLDQTWWTDQGLGEKEYQMFSSGDLNIAPASGEKIFLRVMTDGNERLLIDNFQLLYDNGSAGVEDPQAFSAMAASESQINLAFEPNNANDDVVIVYDGDGTFEDPSGQPPSLGQSFAGGTLLYQGLESPQVHAGLQANETVFYRAWSFTGDSYSPGLSAQATTGGTAEIPNAWINEIHYDNDGGDLDEFVEIVIENPDMYDLSGMSVFLYNGSNGEHYASETVDNFVQGTTVNGFTFYTWFYPGIQNGSPEGVALAADGLLISGQFLSYEGIFTGTNGPASGVLSTDIGVEEPTANPVGYSLQLSGSGLIYSHFVWASPADDTPGTLNNNQEIGNYTIWTGLTNNNWHLEGNWDNGIPTSLVNALIPDASSGTVDFPVITGAAEVSKLVIEPGAFLEIGVTGTLSVFNHFVNEGTLRIKSDASGSGSLIEPDGIQGIAEQYISPGQWHYISSPIDELFSDVFEGLYLMTWDEPAETWTFIEDLGVQLSTGLSGYGVWAETASVVEFNGMLNMGAVSMDLTNSPGSSNPENDPSGYNLAGNPYPSALDWDVEDGQGWTRTSSNVALSLYFWNGTQYASYVKGGPNPGPNGGTNIIPPHQGFFVKCTSVDGGTLTVDDGARVHSGQPFYKEENDAIEFIRFQLTGDSLSDEMIVQLNELASHNVDDLFDAHKMYGCEEAPQVYSFAMDNTKLSINTIPGVQDGHTIPLGYRTGNEGLYELILSESVGFEDIPVFLEDLEEARVIDLKLKGAYKFHAQAGEFENRFIIHLSEDEIPVKQFSLNFDTPLIFVREKKVVVTADQPLTGSILITDLLGREIGSDRLAGVDHFEYDMRDKRGWFIVRVTSNGGGHARKIYVGDK